jgi:preprotein translocase subunit SecA
MSEIRKLAGLVSTVNSFEPRISSLSDAALRAKTDEFRDALAQAEKEQAGLIQELEVQFEESTIPEEKEKIKERLREARNKIFEGILPEAFAVVREAARRTIGLRHFDVQILGGIVLHQGKIAEMATGEGKTLVATLPAYLNALLGRGVHIVTVNDYLARRDREWMGPIYEFLGLTVGVIQHDMDPPSRKIAYSSDVTYGTNNEFGFDYLRDNMVVYKENMVQRGFYYAIVDEVDSILIDEARTPLIISGPAEESTEKYYIIDRIIPRLKGRIILEKEQIHAKSKGLDLAAGFDYIVDEKSHAVALTEEGEEKVCRFLNIDNLHEIRTMDWRHHIIQALKAHNLFKRDVDYVVKDGKVVIVDEFTGRLMPGRRWSDGLHQAVEAKEGLKIERENQTLATITFQNYFRMYEKLAGMTGTAVTEATEFKRIYNLDAVVIPTNRPLRRTNFSDCVYRTQKEKFDAIVREIIDYYNLGRPVLVGTISIEKSEILSGLLKVRGIPHNVLNAKYHELEAQIIAQAGRFKAVTIATNMAGRGTDILLGGNAEYMARNLLKQKGIGPHDSNFKEEYRMLLGKFKKQVEEEHNKVVELGGLHIIGTERHEARRIDNQLRGRAGRQGDPGSSRFYVSLEDDLMRLFGSDRISSLMQRLGMEEGQVIEHPLVTRSIEIAQKRVEMHNFEIREHLLKYDTVMNRQREVIYAQRKVVLEGGNLKEQILEMLDETLEVNLQRYLPQEGLRDEWDWPGLSLYLKSKFGYGLNVDQLIAKTSYQEIKDFIYGELLRLYEQKEEAIGKQAMRHLERMVLLQVIDSKWKDHLYAMDILSEGIGLRAYAQRDPLVEYQREAFDMFEEMMLAISQESVEMIFKIQPVRKEEALGGVFSSIPWRLLHQEISGLDAPIPQRRPRKTPAKPLVSGKIGGRKIGRNEPCPCGSGKKYKRCCGR